MTIEMNIERIAAAAERQAVALEAIAKANLLGAQMVMDAAEEGPQNVEPSYAEKRKAELAAEAAKKEVAEKPVVTEKKGPGRPKKTAEPKPEVKEEPTPRADEEDPFASPVEEPEVQPTLEDVRKVLIALREKVGKDKSYALLREAGKGASYLPGSTQGNQAGAVGELKPENFAAVIKAAKLAIG